MWLFFNVNLYQDAGEFMDENVSYAHFGTAFFSLFRQTTGEAWNGIMYYCSETDPYLGCASTNSGFLVSFDGPCLQFVVHVNSFRRPAGLQAIDLVECHLGGCFVRE